MKRRLMVAKAMVHAPPVLILDEPTAGVDVELRRQLWNYVKALNEEGVTIVLTTHYLEEAESLCDQIAIINRGEVVVCEPTTTLLRRMDTRMVLVTPDQPLAEALQRNATALFKEPIPACGTPLYTDVRIFGEAGIPGVLYGAGPRTVLESHAKRADERLDLEDLRRATKVIARSLHDLLS
jgi:ABC-type multidrug transport system ATPase subunit